jgi:hypothetical protein
MDMRYIRHKVIIVLERFEAETLLQCVYLGGTSRSQNIVHIIDHEGDILAAIDRHSLLDGCEVLPLGTY